MSERRGVRPGDRPPAGTPLLSHALSLLRQPCRLASRWRGAAVRADVLSGLSVAAIAIPQALAYAAIIELPPETGLWVAGLGAIAGALWGSSHHLSTGPTNATSLLVFSVLLEASFAPSIEPGRFLMAASVLAIMAGLIRIVLALIRFGALVTLASRPVLLGFAAGAGVLIALAQLRHLLGLPVSASHDPIRMVSAGLSHLHRANLACAALGAGTIVLVIGLRRLDRRIPASLTAVLAGAIAVALFDLTSAGVPLFGSPTTGLPSFTFAAARPAPDLGMVRDLAVGAMAVAALGLIEAMASAQTVARKTGQVLDNNQEFFGQGMANILCGLFSGFPCSGSLTRTSLNQQAGARTSVSSIITGLIVLVVALAAAPLAAMIPRASLAGVLWVVAWRMIDRQAIRRVMETSRAESAVLLSTFGATLLLPLEFAVLSGVVLSLAFFVIRSSLPRVYQVVPDETFRHFIHAPDAPRCPQVAVVNLRGALFFGAVYHVEETLRDQIHRNPGQNRLVLRMHGVDLCDTSGIEMLERIVRLYRDHDGDLYLIRVRRPVLAVMEDAGFLDILGRDHILPQEGAIEHLFEEEIDPSICIHACEQRVFAECQAIEKHPADHPARPTRLERLPDAWYLDAIEVRDWIAESAPLVIDVREAGEFDRGHLPGARLLPLRNLIERHRELPPDRPFLVVCRSGRRTERALRILADLGYTQARGLRGGYLAWLAAGLPHTAPGDSAPGAEGT